VNPMTTKHKHDESEHDHKGGDHPHIHDGMEDSQYLARVAKRNSKATKK